MPTRRRNHLLLLPILLLLSTSPALADRPGWNEPGRAPGYNQDGLLRINTNYFNMAAATGGDFYYWAPGEFAASAGLFNVPIASEPIVLAYASEGGTFRQVQDIPVDGTISQLSLFAGAQRLDRFRLFRPDGRSVDENPAGVTVQSFRFMRIVTVVDPEPGVWRVEMSGEGSFELAARYLAERRRLQQLGLKGIDLIDFSFVELRGRPGHQGLFALKETPPTGTRQRCRMTLTGGVEPLAVELVSDRGYVIGQVELEPQPELPADEFIGSCLVPDQPFRVRVTGKGPQDWTFQRVTSGLLAP